MSGSYFDPDWTAKVTVPVKRVGDRWEFFSGGDVPVREGTLGELTLSAEQITDESFRQRVMQELTVKILDEGTELLVALSDRDTNGRRAGAWPEPYPPSVPPGTTRFERIWLGPVKKKPDEQVLDAELERGGLWLKLKGLERCELQGSTVRMPTGFQPPVAISLNHAFTMLSQAYEKHRISNTGNVYSRVFYQDRDKRWYPLDDLRTGVQAEGERKLLNELWAQVEQTLGWRPAPPVSNRKRKRT
jgi:hypothetical protein